MFFLHSLLQSANTGSNCRGDSEQSFFSKRTGMHAHTCTRARAHVRMGTCACTFGPLSADRLVMFLVAALCVFPSKLPAASSEQKYLHLEAFFYFFLFDLSHLMSLAGVKGTAALFRWRIPHMRQLNADLQTRRLTTFRSKAESTKVAYQNC